jgi:anti-sigma B factor antagonist
MELEARLHDNTLVIKIKGSIDALTAEEVTNFLHAQLESGHKNMIADLAGVDFMSSAGLRVILSTLKESRNKGGDFRLAAPQPGIEKTLNMSGFTTILKMYPTLDQAVADFAA